MKLRYVLPLFLFALCFTTASTAQQAQSESDKKVIVIKKTIDENGEYHVEKIVTSGDAEDVEIVNVEGDLVKIHSLSDKDKKDCAVLKAECIRICEEKAALADGQDVRVIKIHGDHEGGDFVNVNVNDDNGQRTITIEREGEAPTVIDLAPGEELTEAQQEQLGDVDVNIWHGDHGDMIWTGDMVEIELDDVEAEGIAPRIHKKIHMITKRLADIDVDMDFDHDFEFNFERPHFKHLMSGSRINCAALGVYVNSSHDGTIKISSLIGSGGAESAGLLAGDVINAVDKTPVNTHYELLKILGQYEPGDRVTVDYEREGQANTAQVELTSWKALPAFANSRHAQVECGDKEFKNDFDLFEPIVTRKVIIIKKGQDAVTEETVPMVELQPATQAYNNTLELTDFVTFPNPTDGQFKIEFRSEALPTVVTVVDVTGKELFRDNADTFSGWYSKEIDLRGNPQGALIISVEQDGKRFTEQVIMQ